jgi:hypothetical protein
MDGGELSCPFCRTALSLRGLISSPGPTDLPDFVNDAVSRLEKKSSQRNMDAVTFHHEPVSSSSVALTYGVSKVAVSRRIVRGIS